MSRTSSRARAFSTCLTTAVLFSCHPPDTPEVTFWQFDPSWLGDRHTCSLAFEPLATDRDAELLVGLGVDEVFVREKRTLLVTWEDPALPDESWELTLAGGWDQVWATRSLAPWDCPSGLLLEANDGADLSYPGGRGEGEYWTTVSEAAPDVRFWQYYAVLPYHTSPDSLRSAVEEQRDPEWIDFRLVLRAEQYREFGSIVVSLDAEDDLGSSRQTLAQGTFTIEDQR